MSLYAQLKNHPKSTKHDIEEAFDGNLCRCTGYRPILDGAKSLVQKCSSSCASNGFCASESGTCDKPHDIEDFNGNVHPALSEKEFDLEFPATLLKSYLTGPLSKPELYSFDNGTTKWYRPTTIPEILNIVNEYPAAKIINGNTEVGIETRFKGALYYVLIMPSDIVELKRVEIKANGVEFGGCMTIANFQKHMLGFVNPKSSPFKSYQIRGFQALLDNVKWFAGHQIRNVAAIAGNIVTASPISDLNPIFVAMGAVLKVQSKKGGVREIPMDKFFLGYRKTALQPSEIVVSIFVPFTRETEYIRAYKQSKRKDDDIAIVNAGLCVNLVKSDSDWIVDSASFAYGGMGPTTVCPVNTIQKVTGQIWNDDIVVGLCDNLLIDIPMSLSTPGGQVDFRKTLTLSFMHKFTLYVSHELSLIDSSVSRLSDRSLSVLEDISRDVSKGLQTFQEGIGPIVGKSVVHTSALKQVTGEAVYIDDIPKLANELYAGIVGSSEAHAFITSVDASAALEMDGVVDYVSWMDIPHFDIGMNLDDSNNPNVIGPVFKDEELFATKEVHFVGQMIGMIVAESESIARAAARKVKVTYEKLSSVFTIEDAIASASFFPIPRELASGAFSKSSASSSIDSDSSYLPLSAATDFVQGYVRMSAQEHFYLETNVSLIIPSREDGEMECFMSTQHPSECQHVIAHVLGVMSNKVTVRVKRMGGAFGGKETRAAFLGAGMAVAARKHGRPVRCMLSREDDMVMAGYRHPFLGKYKVGFTKQGKLVSLEADVYSNAGYSVDLSKSVLERAMTHIDNCYKIPNMRVSGLMCKTNLPTNTAFRGFGGPQGMMISEGFITHVAEYLKLPVEKIRELNFYQVDQVTHFSQPLDDFHIERVWHELIATSDFTHRKLNVAEFNAKNKYRKRGIICMPTKFGLSFTARFLNQASALVHVYTDGSVLVSHGGTEMGQGLHTKMVQVCAQAFGISIEKVHLSETNTAIVANTSATAASVSSDLNGMAILNACTDINKRLDPYRAPGKTWEEVVQAAYFDRVNLSANGHYKTPDLTYDWDTNSGRMYSYFTYGAACTEVEVDILSGDHSVLRSDLVMDIGTSINPAIDIGQIEGAFAQGQGWCTIEEPLISPTTGTLLTRGPGAYKIPGFRDIPVDFRVRIVKGSRNVRAIHSSKAVGEPPFFLGASVFYAIRDAVKSARAENGVGDDHFIMDCPATSERIRLACGDKIALMSATVAKKGEKPWSVRS